VTSADMSMLFCERDNSKYQTWSEQEYIAFGMFCWSHSVLYVARHTQQTSSLCIWKGHGWCIL